MILKNRASVLLLLFLFSCSITQDETNSVSEDTTETPIELASDDHTNAFLNQVFKEQLASFEEITMVDFMNTEKPDQFYRLTLIPSHSRKTIIRITESQQKSELVFKGTDFDELTTVMTTRLNTKVLDSLSHYVDQSNFWELDNREPLCDGADGTIFILEVSKDGETNTLLRWSPGICKRGNSDAILKLSNYISSLVNLRVLKDLSSY
ncbi:MAG: hypothetical protein Roseis2KO_45740 [Roseivirga sp.]